MNTQRVTIPTRIAGGLFIAAWLVGASWVIIEFLLIGV